MQTNLAKNYVLEAEELIERLKNGEEHIRGYLIESFQRYIMSIVSKMTGKPAESTDEYSIALQAFNEAIDCYDRSKKVSFVNFAGIVINRRIIDNIRKNNKFNAEFPFTYFEADENENYADNLATQNPSLFVQRIEFQEEIQHFKANLALYGISFDDLVKLCPKHLDTKKLCISIAKNLSDNIELSQKLEKDKRLPISEILTQFNLSRKTLDNHRKYIIALYLIINSDMETIKSHISFLVKEV